MKKYLMTGMAAIAFCAAFTSCSKDENLYDPEAARAMEIDQVYQAYNEAFIRTFGQPAANQDWGFGSYSSTRAANVEGNLWHLPNYYNLKYDAPVTDAEKNLVFNYVNNPNQVETVNQISFTNYWVSQIWDGDSDKNENEEMAPISHSYPNQNGAITDIVGGAQMDKLEIKEAEGKWTHCNNYNNGTNNDWKEGGKGGRTLMKESGTLSFRYTNSQSSYLSEKYIIVPGANIDPSLSEFYYVCFDFERGYVAGEEEKTMGSYEAWNGNNYQGGWNFSLDGFLNEDQVKAAIGQVNGKDIQNIQIKGYLNGDKHCTGDDNYTDWIVRISPAEVVNGSDYSVRIMAEDLNAKAVTGTSDYIKGEVEESDWDFNDVVFDVKFDTDGSDGAWIRLICAGGVLPLRVAGHEVHQEFGVEMVDGLYPMINTGAGPNKPYKEFHITSGADKANKGYGISIEVEKELSNGTKEWLPLTARKGQPASKFAVLPTVSPCTERQHINTHSNGAFARAVLEGSSFASLLW